MMLAEMIETVPVETLQKSKVSMRELNDIRKLVKFDEKILTPDAHMHPSNDIEPDNPYSFFVDFDRLPSKIPKDIKQLLYRPERMGRLSKAFERLALNLNIDYQRRLQDKRDWELNKSIRLDWNNRQPRKDAEELDLINQICR